MNVPHHLDAFSSISVADLRRIFDAVPTPCLILSRDLEIVAANAAYLKVTMTRLADILGRPVFEAFPDNPEDAGATGVANLRASLERVLETGLPDTMPVQRYDIRRPPAQRGEFEERYWSPVNTPVLGEQGNVAYLVHRVLDVTDFVRLSREARQSDSEREAFRQRIEALELEMFQRAQERQEIIQRLRDGEQTLRLVQQIGRIGTFDCDMAANSVRWSAEIAALYGFPAKAFTSQINKWYETIHLEDRARLESEIAKTVPSGSFEAEWRVVWPDGTVRWMAGRAVLCPDESGARNRMLGVNIDITDRKNAEETLRRAALHDPLTGLPNRALIFEFGGHLLGATKRGHRGCARLFVDLDRFKPINDTYGHEAGDAVLREVARRLRECTREEDLVGRLGGDEFVVLLPGIDGVANAAQHILDAISRPIRVNALELSISPSIGISYYPEQGEDMTTLLQKADTAMYEAKQRGRGTYQMFTSDLEDRAAETEAGCARLKMALERGGLMLYYQPIVNLHSGRLVAAEALLRMVLDDGRTVGPYAFMRDINSSGLGAELDEWVLTTACRQHEDWVKRGLGKFLVSVNISPAQFRQPAFPEKVRQIVSETGMDLAQLRVEISGGILEHGDKAMDAFRRFGAIGVKTALDGFGETPFTLGQLSTLPVDRIKMEQTIVRGIGAEPRMQAIPKLVIALGQILKFEVGGRRRNRVGRDAAGLAAGRLRRSPGLPTQPSATCRRLCPVVPTASDALSRSVRPTRYTGEERKTHCGRERNT